MKAATRKKTERMTVEKRRKTPERMCVACGEMKGKESLLRIMKDGAELRVDDSGKGGGRGAYVCRDLSCIEKMCRKRLLNRAFLSNVPEAAYTSLLEELTKIYG